MQDATSGPLDASVLHLLHRVGQVADEMFAKEMKDDPLTPRQFAVLSVLAHKQTASQTDIVEATGIDRSTLADIVRRLVERGLLGRKRSKIDARAYDVRLTTAGQNALKAAQPAVARVEERILRQLPQAKRSEFVDSLSLLVHSLRSRDPAPGDTGAAGRSRK